MNSHIELVKKWLADPESVSLEELKANSNAGAAAAAYAASAAAAFDGCAVDAAVGHAAAYAAYVADAAAAKYWVKCYEELMEPDA